VVVGWADIPELSTCVGCCSAPWLQSWLQWRRNGADPRPSAFQAGHIPSRRGSSERYALPTVAADSGWLLLMLSLLLSAAGPGPRLRGLPGAVTAPCPSQAPPPNPIAAGPDGRRVLSRGGAADHEVTPQAPLTGSGCREHSYGGFGGGHPHFHPHAPDLLIRRYPYGTSGGAQHLHPRIGLWTSSRFCATPRT
jgi:hypothetical protein